MDFDGDGNNDIISGSWPGELYLFRRNSDGSFEAAQKIEDRNKNPIKVGSAAAVYAADWDGDEDLDLLVGNIEGDVYLVANGGTRNEPLYGTPQKIMADGEAIQVAHGDAGPAVADWDGDGLADLVVGSGAGGVLWFRNEGTSGEPKLAKGTALVADSPNQFGQETKEDRCGMRTKVCVADYDADGRPDLLVGDFSMASTEQNLTKEERAAGERARKKLEALIEELTTGKPAAADDEKESEEETEAADEAEADEAADEEAAPEDEEAAAEDEPKDEEGASDEEAAEDESLEQLSARQRKLMEEIQAAQAEYRKYQPTQYGYHGYVWLFRRQAVE